MYRFISNSNHTHQRKTSSRLIDCPFEVVFKYFKSNNSWRVISSNDCHSHAGSMNGIGHPSARRLTSPEKEIIKSLSRNNISVSNILNVLRTEYNNTSSTSKEVRNEIHNIRQSTLNGLSPIQLLYNNINSSEYDSAIDFDCNGSITMIYFSNRQSINLVKRWKYVFVMDCTYKCNKFGFPLLNIVGITATYHTFNAGFAFIREETALSYKWALQKFQLSSGITPAVVVTDRELALINM